MATPSNPNHVRVPRPSRKSFNKARALAGNALLENQVHHFHELEKRLRAELDAGIRYADVRTEGDAAAYVKKMTEILHHRFRSAGQ